MKKALSLALAVVMLLSVVSLFSCGKTEEETTVAESETASNEIEIVETKKETDPNEEYDAEIKNFNGHEFIFAVRDTQYTHLNTNEVYAEELNGETINDAVYKRNSKLEKDYNCKIVENRFSSPVSSLEAALTAGEYVCDYIYDAAQNEFRLTKKNLACDLSSLENIDMNKAWWDQNARKGLSVYGKLFFAVGDAGTMDERTSWVMMFNKDRLEQLGLEIPYAMVDEGKWTIAKMFEYMQKTTQDKDGDGNIEWNKDYVGYTGERLNSWMHVAACGVSITQTNDAGELYLPDTLSQKFSDAWSAIKPIMTTKDAYYCTDSSVAFKNGLSTFYAINCATVINSMNTTVTFGIIPLPKLNDAQEEYYSSVDSAWYAAFIIPVTVDDAPDYEANGFKSGREQAAYFLEAYGYESSNTLTIAFYDQVLMRQTAQDPESRRMIELALKNRIYDPAILFSWGSLVWKFYLCVNPENGMPASSAYWENIYSQYESALPTARETMEAYTSYIRSL